MNSENILDSWEKELTDIIWACRSNSDFLNKELKAFIEELLEAKEDQDYWLYMPN